MILIFFVFEILFLITLSSLSFHFKAFWLLYVLVVFYLNLFLLMLIWLLEAVQNPLSRDREFFSYFTMPFFPFLTFSLLSSSDIPKIQRLFLFQWPVKNLLFSFIHLLHFSFVTSVLLMTCILFSILLALHVEFFCCGLLLYSLASIPFNILDQFFPVLIDFIFQWLLYFCCHCVECWFEILFNKAWAFRWAWHFDLSSYLPFVSSFPLEFCACW